MSAFCIEIKKESENDNMVLYKVNDVFDKDIFYVSIEPKCNLIKFYELDNLNDPILSIDYINKKRPIGQPIKGHDEQTFIKTAAVSTITE